jgi:preprotein translocase subunit YajC
MKSKFYYLTTMIIAASLSACIDPNATGQGKGTGSSIGPLIFLPLIILVFWLFFIRPQTKRQKEQKTFIEGLHKGDKVVTIAGIHGTINKMNEDGTIMLEISPGSYLKMERSSISMEMTKAVNKAGTVEKK